MNKVMLIGRLTKDPDVRYGQQTQMATARFSIAIDRGKDRNGNDLGVDFPGIVCFGKTAELVEKYCYKGQLVGITGRVQTGSYDKDGQKVYTTDVAAERVEFLSRKEDKPSGETPPAIPEGFAQLTDDEIPF